MVAHRASPFGHCDRVPHLADLAQWDATQTLVLSLSASGGGEPRVPGRPVYSGIDQTVAAPSAGRASARIDLGHRPQPNRKLTRERNRTPPDDGIDEAREWVRRILNVEPGYQPDLDVENLAYAKIVQDLKPRWYTWPWRGNEWHKWIGRAALATGVVVAIGLAKKDEEPDLPGPPCGPQ